MKVVLASTNVEKIRELKLLLANLPIEIVPQTEFKITEVDETGLSFIENAILKARHASALTGLPAIADDSGLAVAALHGAPGIYSARYADEHGNAKKNIEKLLNELKNVPDDKRHADFHCVLAYVEHAKDPTPLVCDGIWSGLITRAPHGEHGFGYDPIFYVPSEKKTAAELDLERKNQISHRGIAIQLLLKLLPDKLCLLSQSKT